MAKRSNHDKFPSIRVPVGPEPVWQGWRDIVARISGEVARGAQRISVEIYPGVFESQVAPEPDVLILADLARWEIQCRQRANQIGNFPAGDRHQSAPAKYKRAFFLDWRVADRVKQALLARVDYLLDTNDPTAPKMCTGEAFRAGCDAH